MELRYRVFLENGDQHYEVSLKAASPQQARERGIGSLISSLFPHAPDPSSKHKAIALHRADVADWTVRVAPSLEDIDSINHRIWEAEIRIKKRDLEKEARYKVADELRVLRDTKARLISSRSLAPVKVKNA